MASSNNRTLDDVRQDIESEREQLAGAAETLRDEISEATNVSAKLRANLPAVAIRKEPKRAVKLINISMNPHRP